VPLRAPPRALVTGAGGFIGHALVKSLKERGAFVRGIDLRLPRFESSPADEFIVADLRSPTACLEATVGADEVYALGAEMGGIGYILSNNAQILHNNVLVSFNTLEAARKNAVGRYFFTSSACVYPEHLQAHAGMPPLGERDAYPALPQAAYGWEKLTTERLCAEYRVAYGVETRVVRFHNIYGPLGDWRGGREKSMAALCRKVALAKLTSEGVVEIWGDGAQRRSYCYIDDAVRGIHAIMASDFSGPINLAHPRVVSTDELVDLIAAIAGTDVLKHHVPGPEGARSRASDNSLLREVTGWEPETPLEVGIAATYAWIERQVEQDLAGEPDATLERESVAVST
jgi:GDP-D-mannose 3', 5'-epimerase